MSNKEIAKLLADYNYVFPSDVSIKSVNILIDLGSNPLILHKDKIYKPYNCWALEEIGKHLTVEMTDRFAYRPFQRSDFKMFCMLFKAACANLNIKGTNLRVQDNMERVIDMVYFYSYGSFERE